MDGLECCKLAFGSISANYKHSLHAEPSPAKQNLQPLCHDLCITCNCVKPDRIALPARHCRMLSVKLSFIVDCVQHCKFLSPKQQQQVRAHPASKAMAAAVMGRLDECNSRALANLAWAQAVMKLGPPEFMPQVCHWHGKMGYDIKSAFYLHEIMRKGHKVGYTLDWKLLGTNVAVHHAS